jgi:DNA-binding beta-propeller fold protein YncE/DNA-directed RNA polymerase subunit RPC12/RpoP
MTHLFLCPSCGAPLDADKRSDTIRCPHCNNSVIVPPELRRPSAPAPVSLPAMLNGETVKRFQELSRLAREGRSEDAVKVFRELTGVSDEIARQAITAMLASQPVVLSSTTTTDRLDSSMLDTDRPELRRSGSGKSGSLFSCVIAGIVIASIALPVFAMLYGMVTNGPLTSLWNRVNPTGYARTVMSFGAQGTGPGYLNDPRSIAVDPVTGSIFVAEYDSGRVQVFDPAGKFLFQWQVEGVKKPYITGISVGHSGKVYLALAANPVLIFDSSNGKALGKIQYGDEYESYESVFALPDGGLLAVVNSEDLVRFDSDGQAAMKIPAAVSTVSDDSELTAHAVASGVGDLYILGTFNYSVFHYSPQGKYISRFGGEGDAPGQLSLATNALAIDGQGRVYVADGAAVKVFSPDGRYLDVILFQDAVFGMTFDGQNNFYVVTNAPEVIKLEIQRAP